ncbi:hypothetical protein D3C80_1765340 [compost metagenome]
MFCIKWLAAVNLLDQLVFFRDDAANASCKLLRIEQIGNTNAVSRSFIHVARTDPLTSRADFVISLAILLQSIKHKVIRHNDMCAVTDFQIVRRKAIVMNIFNFIDQRFWINNHPVADYACFIMIKNP